MTVELQKNVKINGITSGTTNGDVSQKLNGHAESAVLYASLAVPPPRADYGEGPWITTTSGHKVYDATCGAAVACIGHNNPRVKQAIVNQLDKISYTYAPFFSTEPVEKLAEWLKVSTGDQLTKSFIVSSGTEAIEAALKLARQYFLELLEPQHKRTRFIGRHHSYHGNTLGSLAVGSHVGRKQPYLDMISSNVSHVSPCYAYRGKAPGESDEEYVARLAQELEDEFQTVGPGNVCAFIVETVSGTTLGCVPPVPGYFKAVREVCDRHGALLILDEVMSGMGRTGTLHAWEQEDVVPDLQTIAKGLGAGYLPIGALLIHEKIADALAAGTGAFVHSQTYQGHAVACAAAYEVQQVIHDDDLLETVRRMGPILESCLIARLGEHKHVGDIRGRGLFWAIEFVEDKQTKKPFPASRKIAGLVHKAALLEFGVSVIPGQGMADGVNGDMIQITPPYNVTEEDIDLIVDRVAKAITHVLG